MKTEKNMKEITLNLWVVYSPTGYIRALRVCPYVMEGTDEEKRKALQAKSHVDFRTAAEYPIPKRLWVHRPCGSGLQVIPVTRAEVVVGLGNPLAAFEEAIQDTSKQCYVAHGLHVPQQPVYCITQLLPDVSGTLRPKVDIVLRL